MYTIEIDKGHVCFEVVRKGKLPDKKTFAIRRRVAAQRSRETSFEALIQRYVVVAGQADEDGHTVSPEGDVERADIGKLAPWHCFWRELKSWTKRASITREGCVELSRPFVPRPSVDIMDETYPTVALVYRLRRDGWISVTEKLIHTRDTETKLAFIIAGPRNFTSRCYSVWIVCSASWRACVRTNLNPIIAAC